MRSCFQKGRILAERTTLPPEAPLRIVAIGGGTGLSTLLHGLRQYARPARPGSRSASKRHPSPVDVTAVVTVTDDGGSSGKLRREFDVLPPGDIRNCLVALSEDKSLLSRLFQYRFSNGTGLKGHSFGNLFLTALTNVTGDFPLAVKFSSEALATLGRIYPSTAANVRLVAELADGTVVRGETRISRSAARIERVRLQPARCKPLRETLEEIAAADLICFGPGSLFTSIIPNLLVSGIPQAIRCSPAVKAYFVNLMWQPGETMNFSASEHVEAIHRHVRCNLLDCAVVNTRPIAGALRQRYAAEKVFPVENDFPRLAEIGLQTLGADLLADSPKVRHDSKATAAVAMKLAKQGRRRRIEEGRRSENGFR